MTQSAKALQIPWRNLMGAACLALALIAAGAILLQQALTKQHERARNEAAREVLAVPAEHVDPRNEGRYVLVSGQAIAIKPVVDADFGIEADALALQRIVHMYRRQAIVGSRPLRDELAWSATDTKPTTRDYFSSPAMLGAFALPRSLVDQLDAVPLRPEPSRPPRIVQGREVRMLEDAAYVGADPSKPQVGDLRITWWVVKPGVVTVLAQQQGSGFAAHPSAADQEVAVIKPGRLTAAQMLTEGARLDVDQAQ